MMQYDASMMAQKKMLHSVTHQSTSLGGVYMITLCDSHSGLHSVLQLAHLFMLSVILLVFVSCCSQPQKILSLLLQEAGVYGIESTLRIGCARATRE